MTLSLALVALSFALAAATIGGGIYEFLVVDPAWPRRLDIVQPRKGGISRRRFWIPVHTAFELVLLASIFLWWDVAQARSWLLVALVSHVIMRAWSFADFIPKGLVFEAATPSPAIQSAALRWVRRSRLRLLLDLTTAGATLAALIEAIRY
jgi:hypothetical protein